MSPAFLLGVAFLLFLLWAGPKYIQGNTRKVGRGLEGGLRIALFGLVIFLLATGRWLIALILVPLALSYLGLQKLWPSHLHNAVFSRFRSYFLEVTVDQRSGAIAGTVCNGSRVGAKLNSLTLSDLIELLDEFQHDADSCALLAAYLDRRFSSWRENADAYAQARQSRARAAQAVRNEEAYEILGLEKGASVEKIIEAHRRLMKRFHPDKGGSDWVAARLNAAKDQLLKTHH